MASDNRPYDVIIYGATGFTGFLTAQYLAANAASNGIRWGIAGRSEAKLQSIAAQLGSPSGLGVLVADSADGIALRAMTKQCRAVASTVGPYTNYGSELVAACVDTKTHYADLTGEYNFIREMIEKHHDRAHAEGVKIVHCCGFDCVPVDLATWMALDQLPVPAASVRAMCTRANGGASGGTLDSALANLGWARKPENKAKAQDPYVLAPGAATDLRVDQKWTNKRGLGYDRAFGTLAIPYMMAPIDNRLVRRSMVMRGQAAEFDEAMSLGAVVRVAGFAAMHLPSFISKLRPKAGDGPAESVRRDGSFCIEVVAKGASGEECWVAASGLGDPGYGATSVILAECVLCLALDAQSAGMPQGGGVLTPSTAMAVPLVRRLERTGRFTLTRTCLKVPPIATTPTVAASRL